MTLREATDAAVDELDTVAGEILTIEANVSLNELTTEERRLMQLDLVSLRRRALVLTQTLIEARREG